MITVSELIEELKKCNPKAIVIPFDYDKEMGIDIERVSSNGRYYSGWDKYGVIDGHIRNGRDVVVLSSFDLEAKYPPEEDDEWED